MMMAYQRVNWPLVVSLMSLSVLILMAIIGHAVMNERRLTALELQLQRCMSQPR